MNFHSPSCLYEVPMFSFDPTILLGCSWYTSLMKYTVMVKNGWA